MALPATDQFTGTNGLTLEEYSSNWTETFAQMQLYSNSVGPGDGDYYSDCGAAWTADTFDDDQYAEADVVANSDGDWIGVAVRSASGAATWYAYGGSNEDKYVYKVVNESYTQIETSINQWSVDDRIRLEVSSTTLIPKLNGSLDTDIGQQTDESITSGYGGVAGYNEGTGNRIDNWEAGNLGALIPAVASGYYRRRRE